jgi:lipoprotein-anchoring transpeptidase ErfK/SrfK
MHARTTTSALLAFALVACGGDRRAGEDAFADRGDSTIRRDSAAARGAGADSVRPVRDTATVMVEVDVAARQLRVLGTNGDTVALHPVAVGSPEWPTRTGTWTIDQVVLNPEWIPPDESWAEEREARKPGDPKNPLGRAQLVYDMPRTVHGTNDPSSVGKAVSHGSIRVTNASAIALAELLLAQTGVDDVRGRLDRARRDSTEKQIIDLPKAVPIRVF